MKTNTIDLLDAELGVTYPKVEDLQTGDILFARELIALPYAIPSFDTYLDSLSGRERETRVRDFLGPTLCLYIETSAGGRTSERTLDDARRQIERWRIDTLSERFSFGESSVALKGKLNLAFLFAVLQLEFKDMMLDWFGLTIEQLIRHPLARVLQAAFDGSVQGSFFIGHCGMVLRETDGAHADDGEVYVIEANVTSFDHYSVSIHPYHLPGDGIAGGGRFRSWAAFRASKGNACWQSRHAFFDGKDPAAELDCRQALLVAAKRYLGRTYSFFDTAVFGDPGRLYCSELLHRSFLDVQGAYPALGALDHGVCTWDWMRKNNPSRQKGDIGDVIEQVYADPISGPVVGRSGGHPFFIITVQMLWRQPLLQHRFLPYNADYG